MTNSASDATRLWDAAAKALALATVMVPVVGVVVRLVRFGTQVPLEVSLALSPAEMALTGLLPVTTSLIVGGAFLLLDRRFAGLVSSVDAVRARTKAVRGELDGIEDDHQRVAKRLAELDEEEGRIAGRRDRKKVPSAADSAALDAIDRARRELLALMQQIPTRNKALAAEIDQIEAASNAIDRSLSPILRSRWLPSVSTRRRQLLLLAASFLVTLCIAAVYRPPQAAVIYSVGVVSASFIGAFGIGRSVSQAAWLPVLGVVALLTLSSAVADGLSPWQAQAEFVRFAPGAALHDGWFGELGRTADAVFLQSCDGAGAPVTDVPNAEITEIAFGPHEPTLDGGILGTTSRLGYVPGCPHPSAAP